MIHKMHLYREPFYKIWSGSKTIELRMFDDKRRSINVGDIIEFFYIDDSEISMKVTVTAIHKAANFKELFEMIPLTKCGYETDDVKDTYLKMEKYPGYSRENQEKLGVIGIEFEKVPDSGPFSDPLKKETFLRVFTGVILQYWQKHPDYRFGQILENFQAELQRLQHIQHRGVSGFYNLEEDEFIDLLAKYVWRDGCL